ncbi:MAG TPA: hypothetical protein VND89_08580 [Acidimicrobiales bacterium]|nr:hypothetical protein [Acidimicrobiales bacterium]
MGSTEAAGAPPTTSSTSAALAIPERSRSSWFDVVKRTPTLVFDAEAHAQGWCQYGIADSLDLKHGREYRKNPPAPAKWRIACIFVDKNHRGEGIARMALGGAISQIVLAGGGRIEAIAETTLGRNAQGRFLFSGTVELFEDLGFTRVRQVGKHAWIVSRTVKAGAKSTSRE